MGTLWVKIQVGLIATTKSGDSSLYVSQVISSPQSGIKTLK